MRNFKLDNKFNWYRIKILGPDCKTLVPVIFRGMTSKEKAHHSSWSEKDEIEADNYYILKLTDLKDVNKFPQGSLMTLIFSILGKSSFQYTVEKAADFFNSDQGGLEMKAVAVLPSVTFELLESCDPMHYARYLVLGNEVYNLMFLPADPNGSTRIPGSDGVQYDVETVGVQRGKPLNVEV